MKNNRFFTGIPGLALVFGTILAGCDNPAGNRGDNASEITGFSFIPTAGPQEGAATAAAGAVAGTFSNETGGTAPFTYSLAAGDGDTNNGLFTIEGTNLKIASTALTEGSKSVRVEVKDSKNKTFVKAVTVTPTDDGQLKIEWTTAQWASNYKVLISERSSLTSAAGNVVTPNNFTGLTITTGDTNAGITLPLQGVTNLQYYVWVIALNGNLETESDQATGTIIDAPANKASFADTTWKSKGEATYTFSETGVVYKNMSGTPEGEGTYDYTKPTLTLTITASGGQHPEWTTPPPQITVKGKVFTINNVTFTRQ